MPYYNCALIELAAYSLACMGVRKRLGRRSHIGVYFGRLLYNSASLVDKTTSFHLFTWCRHKAHSRQKHCIHAHMWAE